MNHQNILSFRAEPLKNLSVGFIGVGVRGILALERYLAMGINVAAVCEIEPTFLEKAKNLAKIYNQSIDFYHKDHSWKQLCTRKDIDLIYISTPWDMHAKMALFALKNGKHTAVEVPLAMKVQDCLNIISVSKEKKRHCMMLENTCYDEFELACLSLAQKGLLGEVFHAEASYIHDLRSHYFQENERDFLRGKWRHQYNSTFNANPYPTHGLAPVCQAMNILRDDHLESLVSVSSGSFSMKAYAEEKFGKDSLEAQTPFVLADINSTLIKTQKGKTILLQHSTNSPRPYSRSYLLSGTKGFVQKYPQPQMSFDPNGTESLSPQAIKNLIKEHLPSYSKDINALAKRLNHQKRMDILMDYRLVHCLKQGLPLDQSVYDGALWSCFVELTQESVLKGNKLIKIPNFLEV